MEGVQVLAFPCNQFGLQEPAKNSEILSILKHVRPGRDYSPNFPVFEKLDVNGQRAHPLFRFMKSQCNLVTSSFAPREKLFYDPVRPDDIEWNFHKFLIDRNGKVVRRYNHRVEPDSQMILNDIGTFLERRN